MYHIVTRSAGILAVLVLALIVGFLLTLERTPGSQGPDAITPVEPASPATPPMTGAGQEGADPELPATEDAAPQQTTGRGLRGLPGDGPRGVVEGTRTANPVQRDKPDEGGFSVNPPKVDKKDDGDFFTAPRD